MRWTVYPFFHLAVLAAVLLGAAWTVRPARAQESTPTATPAPLTPYDLIPLLNQPRIANGLPALTVNAILMGTAQATAEYMAANNMSGHIGNVQGRVMDAGYGNGAIAWASENFAMLPGNDLKAIQSFWSDPVHMIPADNPAYTDIGAGIATASDGTIYFVVHAAYVEKGTSRYQLTTLARAAKTAEARPTVDPQTQYVYGVTCTTPGEDGKLVHTVRQGQSLWSIAIAYGTHIRDICLLNGLSVDSPTVYTGQKLLIPTLPATATPEQSLTPVPSPTSIPATPSPASVQAAASTPTPPSSRPQAAENNLGIIILVLVVLGVGLIVAGSVFRG